MTRLASMNQQKIEYGGFWIRVIAALIDSALLIALTLPLLLWIYGESYLNTEQLIAGPADLLLSWIVPAIAVIIFWHYRSATPGKMVTKLKIIDACSGGPPSTGQLIGRYLGYYVSTIPLALGLLWVAFDDRKQGWHDKLAGTVVVRTR